MGKKSSLDKLWITLIVIIILSILSFIILPIYISLVLLVAIYLPIILFVLIYKWIRGWFAALVFAFSIWLNIVLIIIPIFIGLTALDISNFSEDLQNQPKYIALEKDKTIIFAAKVDSLSLELEEVLSSVKVLNKKELLDLEEEIDNSVKNKVIFLVKDKAFSDVSTVEIEELKLVLSKDEIFDLLKADDIDSYLSTKLGLDEALIAMVKIDQDQVKLVAFFLLIKDKIETSGPDSLIKELKEGNIKIYPRKLSIELLIRFLPTEIATNFGIIPELPETTKNLITSP